MGVLVDGAEGTDGDGAEGTEPVAFCTWVCTRLRMPEVLGRRGVVTVGAWGASGVWTDGTSVVGGVGTVVDGVGTSPWVPLTLAWISASTDARSGPDCEAAKAGAPMARMPATARPPMLLRFMFSSFLSSRRPFAGRTARVGPNGLVLEGKSRQKVRI